MQELNDPEKVLSIWVRHLYELVDWLNNRKMQMTGMKPKGVMELEKVPLVHGKSYLPEDTLPEDGLCHYLLQTREKHNERCKRATDRI